MSVYMAAAVRTTGDHRCCRSAECPFWICDGNFTNYSDGYNHDIGCHVTAGRIAGGRMRQRNGPYVFDQVPQERRSGVDHLARPPTLHDVPTRSAPEALRKLVR